MNPSTPKVYYTYLLIVADTDHVAWTTPTLVDSPRLIRDDIESGDTIDIRDDRPASSADNDGLTASIDPSRLVAVVKFPCPSA